MAGQIEEPITFNFQADSVHSGSISFGRFAHEPLLWERRSSFSHNRIQEEVARCSKHRIVTEKKAYFEAQFKKKALLRRCSLDVQTGMQFETTEKETPETRSLKEDYHKEDNGFVQEHKNDSSSETSVYVGYREDYDYVQEAQVSVHFEESSDSSNDFEEQGMMEYNIEGREILISEPLKIPLSDSVVAKVMVDDGTFPDLDTQTVIDCTYSRYNSAEHDVEVEQNIEANTCYVDEGCKTIGLCAGSREAEKEPDALSYHRVICPKIMVATEPSGTESTVKVTHTQRDSLCEEAKKSSRNFTRVGKQSVLETKTYKQSNMSLSTSNILARSPNPENLLKKSTNSVAKTLSAHKSAYKETRVIKVTKSHLTTMMKDAPNAHKSPNGVQKMASTSTGSQSRISRTEKVTAPENSDLRTCPPSCRFRSDVRAEKKKEVPSRMEQTSHIQMAETNRSHARTQDKTPVEIKQVRSSVNIKAKPMQSPHNKDESLESKSKGAIANRPHIDPSHSRTKVVARSSTYLKADNVPQKSLFQVSTITSPPGKKPANTSAVASLFSKSTHVSSMRNAVTAKRVAGNDKAAKLKNQTVPPKVETMKGRVTIGVSQSVSERPKKCVSRKVSEKPRLQQMCRTAAKVC